MFVICLSTSQAWILPIDFQTVEMMSMEKTKAKTHRTYIHTNDLLDTIKNEVSSSFIGVDHRGEGVRLHVPSADAQQSL